MIALRVPGLKNSAEGKVYTMHDNVNVQISDSGMKLLQALGERLGKDIVLMNRGDQGDGNGVFDAGEDRIYVRADRGDYAVALAMHEAVHAIRDVNPAGYAALREFVMNYHASIGQDVDEMVQGVKDRWGDKVQTREGAIEEIVANTVMAIAADEAATQKALGLKENRSILEQVADALREIARNLRTFLKGNTDNPEARAIIDDADALTELAQKMDEALEGAKENTERIPAEALKKINAHKGARYIYEGKTKDGRSIYKTNYPSNTPKDIKRQDIVDIVQKVWSKEPIRLIILENGKQKEIIAQFNPTLEVKSDLSKIAFGNRKGNASEQRITLDLSTDLYQIAEESTYNFSKDETGKDNPAHKNVTRWHYFVTNLVYRDNNNNKIDCHMNIDVKQNNDGYWFYSFAIEKGTAPQTLLAAVTEENSATVPTPTISQSSEESKQKFSVNDLLDEEFDDEQALWDEEAERREKEKQEQELYDMPRSESFFEGRSDEDVQKLINEASDSLSFIIRQSAESTAEKAIRGYKQYALGEKAAEKLARSLAKDYDINIKAHPESVERLGEIRTIRQNMFTNHSFNVFWSISTKKKIAASIHSNRNLGNAKAEVLVF